jgi:hypothetical protein
MHLHHSNKLRPCDVQAPPLYTPQEDFLSTEPKRLVQLMETILMAYESSRGKASMIGQTADMMHPDVIKRMREIKEEVQKKFL